MASPINTLLHALSSETCLTVEELARAIGLRHRAIVQAAAALIARGFAERAERGCFTLTAEGEAFRATGRKITSGPRAPLTQTYRRWRKPTLRDRLWGALRIRGKASTPELLELAGDGERDYSNAAQKYLAALVRAGYLRTLRREPGTAPTSNGYKRYALIRNTGPEAPQLRVKTQTLFDPNTGETFSLSGDPAGGAP